MSTEKKRLTLPIIRLVSGLIVMLYTFGHLLNHALGLVSLEAMEQGRELFSLIWRSSLLYWVVPTASLFTLCCSVGDLDQENAQTDELVRHRTDRSWSAHSIFAVPAPFGDPLCLP